MKRIGLLSDTHGYWDDRYLKYFECCDEIWHAGDIGSMEVVERLQGFRQAACRIWKHRRAGYPPPFPGSRPLLYRRCGCNHETYRRLSG